MATVRARKRATAASERLLNRELSFIDYAGRLVELARDETTPLLERLFFLSGVVFIIGSVCDTLDGRYSRMSGKGTPFGAFLDSTLDRIEEGVVLTTVAAYFGAQSGQILRGRNDIELACGLRGDMGGQQ